MVVPTTTTADPTTLARLQQIATLLQSYGITDLAPLGAMALSGAVVPQVGLSKPPATATDSLYEPQTTKYGDLGRYASKVSPDGTRFEAAQGDAKMLRVQPPPAGVTVGVNAYIVAQTLNLADNTNLVLRYPNAYLTIIAEHITVGNNVTITWERPALTQPTTPAKPAKKPTAAISTTLTGINGETGTPGTKGFEDVRTTGKGVLDGLDAPEIELWTLDLSGHPAIDVRGEDGVQGGSGGAGGDGGDGGRGRAAIAENWLGVWVCKSGPGSGGNGGNGGPAGAGGTGGKGGHGGRFALYAPQAVLSAYATGFNVSASGGAAGPGGMPGAPGAGGNGGQIGANPYNCSASSPRTAGKAGLQGATAVQGSWGSAGLAYVDAIKFCVVPPEEFINRMLAPGITALDPAAAHAGEPVNVQGVHFLDSDTLLIDNQPVAKTGLGLAQLQFTVPDLPGGRHTVRLRQVDSTLSNPATLAVVPKITTVSPTGRIRPGSTVTLSGSGFGSSATVTVNGSPVTGVQASGNTQLTFTLQRPSNLTPNPTGEPVTLQVLVPEVVASNQVNVTLDTIRMIVLGDSVMWGQGLTLSQKAHNLVKDVVRAREGDISVFTEVYAHSGAVIGCGEPEDQTPLHGEVPTRYPSILQQVNMVPNTPDTVDIVLMDGGINDVDVFWMLDPTSMSDLALTQSIESHCNGEMQALLARVIGRFPSARIVVCGYYPIVSTHSNILLLELFASAIGLALAGIPGAIVGDKVTESFKAAVARRAALFASQSNVSLQRAVDAANLAIAANPNHPTCSVVLAQPQIGPEHAALSPDPWIWGIAANAGPEDYMVAPERCVACHEAPPERSPTFTCERASAGHPNAVGAQAYASAILAVL